VFITSMTVVVVIVTQHVKRQILTTVKPEHSLQQTSQTDNGNEQCFMFGHNKYMRKLHVNNQ